MIAPHRPSCDDCFYLRRIVHGFDFFCCHYILLTGEPRGCPAEHCTRHRHTDVPREKRHFVPADLSD